MLTLISESVKYDCLTDLNSTAYHNIYQVLFTLRKTSSTVMLDIILYLIIGIYLRLSYEFLKSSSI